MRRQRSRGKPTTDLDREVLEGAFRCDGFRLDSAQLHLCRVLKGSSAEPAGQAAGDDFLVLAESSGPPQRDREAGAGGGGSMEPTTLCRHDRSFCVRWRARRQAVVRPERGEGYATHAPQMAQLDNYESLNSCRRGPRAEQARMRAAMFLADTRPGTFSIYSGDELALAHRERRWVISVDCRESAFLGDTSQASDRRPKGPNRAPAAVLGAEVEAWGRSTRPSVSGTRTGRSRRRQFLEQAPRASVRREGMERLPGSTTCSPTARQAGRMIR